MKITFAFIVCLVWVQLYSCDNNIEIVPTTTINKSKTDTTNMKITVGSTVFTVILNNNASADAFKANLPITINMIEFNGNEKYFDLPNALPTNATKPATIKNGDLMLFGSNTLVLFYKNFSTTYSYTPIGRVENPTALAAALGSGSVTVKFELY